MFHQALGEALGNIIHRLVRVVTAGLLLSQNFRLACRKLRLDLLGCIPGLAHSQDQLVRGDKPFSLGLFHPARRSVDLGALNTGGLVDSVYC